MRLNTSHLATWNTLSMIADFYGVIESTPFMIVHEYCKAMKIHLKPLVFEKLTKNALRSYLKNSKICLAYFISWVL